MSITSDLILEKIEESNNRYLSRRDGTYSFFSLSLDENSDITFFVRLNAEGGYDIDVVEYTDGVVLGFIKISDCLPAAGKSKLETMLSDMVKDFLIMEEIK